MSLIELKALAGQRSCDECVLHPMCKPALVGIEDIERLSGAVLARRPMGKDAVLFRAGEPMRSVFVAQSGGFKTVATNEAGDEQVIGFYFPGELIGLEGLRDGRFSTDAVALESAQVCEVPLPALERVATQRLEFQRQMMRALGEGMARHQDHLELLGRKQAQERLAMFLHGLCERQQRLGRDPSRLHLPMSRSDIGSYLSLVIETVSRGLSKLQDEGVIAVKGRQLEVLDADRLVRLAHGEEGEGERVAGRR
jgi:CRP/FNR family transcriptional regulator